MIWNRQKNTNEQVISVCKKSGDVLWNVPCRFDFIQPGECLNPEIPFAVFDSFEMFFDEILDFGVRDFGNFILYEAVSDEFCDG